MPLKKKQQLKRIEATQSPVIMESLAFSSVCFLESTTTFSFTRGFKSFLLLFEQ